MRYVIHIKYHKVRKTTKLSVYYTNADLAKLFLNLLLLILNLSYELVVVLERALKNK